MSDRSPEMNVLLAKADRAASIREPVIDAVETVRPPLLVSRAAFTDIVSQLFHAETATAAMCRSMSGNTGDIVADALLRRQAEDEIHHADLYASYLARIGDIRPVDSRIEEALDALLNPELGPEAVIAGYNIVLEGEAVKLQQDTIDRFTCPALGRITRAITRDESRHVAFGHAWLPAQFGNLEQDHRFAIYRHVRRCWRLAATHPNSGRSLFSTILARARSEYMSARWAHHDRALRRAGLIRPDEKSPI